jgi:hypothetical protein
MAETSNENQKAETIKKLEEQTRKARIDKSIVETALYRKELAEKRMAMDLDALAKLYQDKFTTDARGNQITLWDNVLNEANHVIKSEQNTYHDWRSSMIALLSLYSLLVSAISQSIREVSAEPMMNIKQIIREKAFYPMAQKVVDKIRRDPRVDIPAILHDVSMGDDNKLKINGLTSANPQEDVSALNNDFKKLVSLWLYEKGGYVPGPEEGTYINQKKGSPDFGKLLTKKQFDKFKSDDDFGLDNFLANNGDLQFRSSPTPTPRP